MLTQFNPYDLCPCDSGRKAKFCCLAGKTWNKKPAFLKPESPITGFAHQKCYAKQTDNCCTKISGEHFISKNILKKLEHNKTVKVVGLPRQKRQTFNLLPIKSLISNVLCIKHNNLLSPFDAEMGRLHENIAKFDEDFNSGNPKNDLAVFCGEDIEKWMIKTACSLIASNQICVDGEKTSCILQDEYIDILFNDKPLPDKWGMYFKIPEDKLIQKFHSILFRPWVVNNELEATEFLLNNFPFYIVLGQPDTPSDFGMYRPGKIIMTQGEITKTIIFCWQDKKYNESISMKRVGTTTEPPSEWEEYLKN